MWPLQPTQGIPDRLAAALAALVVTGAVLTLILMLTMGGRHEAKRAVTLPVVYWSGPPPEGVFRASALRVVRRWAFMPPAEPAWQRLTIRYELEK